MSDVSELVRAFPARLATTVMEITRLIPAARASSTCEHIWLASAGLTA
jgi:hypothetical protein